MKALTCPHDRYPCGRETSDIVMSLNSTQEVVIGRLFDEKDSCHFTIEVPIEQQSQTWNLNWL